MSSDVGQWFGAPVASSTGQHRGKGALQGSHSPSSCLGCVPRLVGRVHAACQNRSCCGGSCVRHDALTRHGMARHGSPSHSTWLGVPDHAGMVRLALFRTRCACLLYLLTSSTSLFPVPACIPLRALQLIRSMSRYRIRAQQHMPLFIVHCCSCRPCQQRVAV